MLCVCSTAHPEYSSDEEEPASGVDDDEQNQASASAPLSTPQSLLSIQFQESIAQPESVRVSKQGPSASEPAPVSANDSSIPLPEFPPPASVSLVNIENVPQLQKGTGDDVIDWIMKR